MSIYVLVSCIVSKVISDKKISNFFDRIRPGETKLIVSLVEFGLKWPFKVELKNIILFEGGSISNLSTESTCSMFVYILLDGSKKRTFFLTFNIDAWIIVNIIHTFKSLLDDKFILFMNELP